MQDLREGAHLARPRLSTVSAVDRQIGVAVQSSILAPITAKPLGSRTAQRIDRLLDRLRVTVPATPQEGDTGAGSSQRGGTPEPADVTRRMPVGEKVALPRELKLQLQVAVAESNGQMIEKEHDRSLNGRTTAADPVQDPAVP